MDTINKFKSLPLLYKILIILAVIIIGYLVYHNLIFKNSSKYTNCKHNCTYRPLIEGTGGYWAWHGHYKAYQTQDQCIDDCLSGNLR
jgi:hypothetical protein